MNITLHFSSVMSTLSAFMWIPLIIFLIIFVFSIVITITGIVRASKTFHSTNLSKHLKSQLNQLKDLSKDFNNDNQPRYCEYCGSQLEKGATSCKNCNAKITKQ